MKIWQYDPLRHSALSEKLLDKNVIVCVYTANFKTEEIHETLTFVRCRENGDGNQIHHNKTWLCKMDPHWSATDKMKYLCNKIKRKIPQNGSVPSL